MAGKVKRYRIAADIVLTSGEKLFIWRQRKNLNQDKAAKIFKTSVFSYKLAEYDKKELSGNVPEEYILLPHERCLIHRRRNKMSQAAVAKEMKISRNWLRQLESGKEDSSRLLAFWEGSA